MGFGALTGCSHYDLRMTRSHVAIALSVLVLVGCAPATSAEQTPSPFPTSTVAVTTTPTPTPTGPPALATLIATPDGLGSLVIGEQPPVGPDALAVFNSTCSVGATPGGWNVTYPDVLVRESMQPPFSLYVDESGVARIDVVSSEIRTATGIGRGSTRDEVLAAYPGGFDEELFEDGLSSVYGIAGDYGWLMIEVTLREEPGRFNVVTGLRIGTLENGIYSTEGTDNSIPACPER